MKKCLLVLFVCTACCAFAQKSFFGVDAGINVANQRVVLTNYLGPYPSGKNFFYNVIKPTFGIFYQYGFTEKVALRGGARYMGLGYRLPQTNSFVYTVKDNVDISYLTLPLSVHYHANKQFILNAGVYLSFTLGGTDRANEEITKTYHKNDFGFSLGGEHGIYKNLALGVNYFIGLKNIWLNDEGGNLKQTNRALQFTLIYKFKKTLTPNS